MKPHADNTADNAWQDDHLRLELKRLQKELDDCRRQLARKEGTDAQEAQDEARAHLWFLENMDRIHRAIQATNNLDEMMSEVLKACLSIFDCDRAWLVYPGSWPWVLSSEA
jgi:hypothetical protein